MKIYRITEIEDDKPKKPDERWFKSKYGPFQRTVDYIMSCANRWGNDNSDAYTCVKNIKSALLIYLDCLQNNLIDDSQIKVILGDEDGFKSVSIIFDGERYDLGRIDYDRLQFKENLIKLLTDMVDKFVD